MLNHCINKLIKGQHLTQSESAAALTEMLTRDESIKSGALLALLRTKGEQADEILGMIQIMHQQMVQINTSFAVMDIVGTGGDGASTFNISTGAAILAACAGVKILKHGNRAVSSQCGSADVLEALGINIQAQPQQIISNLIKQSFAFCYAPNYHPILAKLKVIRSQLGIRTIFNIIPPLLNPAKAKYLMIGAATMQLQSLIAEVMMQSDIERAVILHCAGLDELACVGITKVIDITPSSRKEYMIDPKQFGFNIYPVSALQGGNAQYNALALTQAFTKTTGALSESLILNAGVATFLFKLVNSIPEGIELVRNIILDGKASTYLNQLREYNHETLLK